MALSLSPSCAYIILQAWRFIVQQAKWLGMTKLEHGMVGLSLFLRGMYMTTFMAL